MSAKLLANRNDVPDLACMFASADPVVLGIGDDGAAGAVEVTITKNHISRIPHGIFLKSILPPLNDDRTISYEPVLTSTLCTQKYDLISGNFGKLTCSMDIQVGLNVKLNFSQALS